MKRQKNSGDQKRKSARRHFANGDLAKSQLRRTVIYSTTFVRQAEYACGPGLVFQRMQADGSLVDWQSIGSNLLHIGAAYVLALPVAWDRERGALGAGLRTFPLVSIAACGYCIVAHRTFPGHADAQARILAGLLTGIGFIGGGAILKHSESVRGVATAASIWATGAIGGAVAFSRFEIAILISVVTFLTLRLMQPIKERIDPSSDKDQTAVSGGADNETDAKDG